MLTPTLLPLANIRLAVRASSAQDVFAQLAALACARADKAVLRTCVRLARRHARRSVALGHGVAVPHAAVTGLGGPVAVYLRAAAGVAMASPDNQPVTEVLALFVPSPPLSADYDLLMSLIQRLQDRSFAARLRRCQDPAQIQALLTGPRGP
jgi:PTS system nitrogen regulatory IIA component